MTPSSGVVLVTRCGCKQYQNWPAMSMREDIIIPLTPRQTSFVNAEIDLSKPTWESRRFRATYRYEVAPSGDKTYHIFEEVAE